MFYSIIDDFHAIKTKVFKESKKSKKDAEIAVLFANKMNKHYGVGKWQGLLYRTFLSYAFLKLKPKGKDNFKLDKFFSDANVDEFRQINISTYSNLRSSAYRISGDFPLFLFDPKVKSEFNLLENEKKEWQRRGLFEQCCIKNFFFNEDSPQCKACKFENKMEFEIEFIKSCEI